MAKVHKKEIHLDLTTFGASKACQVLADMMNQNMISTFEKHKVLSFLNGIYNKFMKIGSVPMEFHDLKLEMLDLIQEKVNLKIDSMPYPPKFKTFMKNVVWFYRGKALD